MDDHRMDGTYSSDLQSPINMRSLLAFTFARSLVQCSSQFSSFQPHFKSLHDEYSRPLIVPTSPQEFAWCILTTCHLSNLTSLGFLIIVLDHDLRYSNRHLTNYTPSSKSLWWYWWIGIVVVKWISTFSLASHNWKGKIWDSHLFVLEKFHLRMEIMSLRLLVLSMFAFISAPPSHIHQVQLHDSHHGMITQVKSL